jgi:hypothetical protein
MRQFQLLLLVVLSSPVAASAQFYFYNDSYYDKPVIIELGISTGIMNCLTDLGGRDGIGKAFIKDINWNGSKLCGGIYASALYNRTIGARIEIMTGQVSANDHHINPANTEEMKRYERNLHFKSNISECRAEIEFHPLALLNPDNIFLLSPYLLSGVGIFKFDPRANLNGNWIRLSPLRTEGQGFREYPQRKPYALTQINFPVGIGLLYEASALVNFRMEILHRFLKTDYLDDVSTRYISPTLFQNYHDRNLALIAQRLADRKSELNPLLKSYPDEIRGNPSKNDGYFSISLKLGFILNRKRH